MKPRWIATAASVYWRLMFLAALAIAASGCNITSHAKRLAESQSGTQQNSGTRKGERNACLLVTRAELEEILKSPLAEGALDRSNCAYATKKEPIGPSVKIEVSWEDGKEEMEAWKMGFGLVDKFMKGTLGQSAASVDAVTGVGDEAFFGQAGFETMLHVRKGDAAFSVQASMASREQALAIARKIVARLK